jgi:transcriptional regulator
MPEQSPFMQVSDEELARLIADAPLCWIVPHAEPAGAILMPVLLERDGDGRPASLLGHLPRRAPAASALAQQGAASFLFLGPNSYISPAMAGRLQWAPTWNFVSARVDATVALDDRLTRKSVEEMVAHMEGAGGWRPNELGDRFADLLAKIVGFRAVIDVSAPRFKLGQDEDEEVFGNIASALHDTPIGEWTRRIAGT